MQTKGNTILVTGGSSGIGRALAEGFHDGGNRVIVTGRRQELLDEIVAARPGMVGLNLDLSDLAAVGNLADRVRADFPQLNVLIANAGISRPEEVLMDSWDGSDAEAIVETNILGLVRVAAAVLPVLKGNPNAAMLATSSALAFVPLASYPTYCASKAFVHSWLVSLRHQLRHVPVEVLEVSPPYVRTGLTGHQQLGDPRAMPVEEYVSQVMQMLALQNHPRGELLLERDQARRWAERDGNFETIFATMNPQ